MFKKGDPALVGNYRPISLLSIAFKIMGSILRQCLLNAGIDDRLWKSQFGFRRGHGTLDSIYVARRRIELAVAQRYGRISMLASDWKKAFDSVNVECLLHTLCRIGLPEASVWAVASMLRERKFFVQDQGSESET